MGRITFNKAVYLDSSIGYIHEAFGLMHLSGDGGFTKRCSDWLGEQLGMPHTFLTTSCSHALDMAAILAGIEPGDEVIMPSFTFSSTANAFLGRGAAIKFIDIRPDTMNIDETLIESAVTEKTKCIVPVHYAGVSCEMDTIMEIAEAKGIWVVEDAAQALQSKYKGRPLGGLADMGCISFHETKNFTMGEGGSLSVRDAELSERAEIIREKGTNRGRFFRGQIDKYSWVDWGSSYLPSDMNAAYLWGQLEIAGDITSDRLRSWNRYYEGLKELGRAGRGILELPVIPEGCVHNGHMFYIKVKDLEERTRLIAKLNDDEITAPYHYVPLHSAEAGRKYTQFVGKDVYTTRESERLLRLPMYYGLEERDADFVIAKIHEFFK